MQPSALRNTIYSARVYAWRLPSVECEIPQPKLRFARQRLKSHPGRGVSWELGYHSSRNEAFRMTTAPSKVEAQNKVAKSGSAPAAPGNNRLPSTCLLLTTLLLCVFFLSCSGGDPKSSARANVNPAMPVAVSTAERRDMPYYL